MADPVVQPDPWAWLPDQYKGPAVDPSVPLLPPSAQGFLDTLAAANANAAPPPVTLGTIDPSGIPAAALSAAPVPPGPPLDASGNPPPLGANGQPALPDVGDQLGMAPDGSGPRYPASARATLLGLNVLSRSSTAIADRRVVKNLPGAASDTLNDLATQLGVSDLAGQRAGTAYGVLNPITGHIESHEDSFSGHPLDNPNSKEAQALP